MQFYKSSYVKKLQKVYIFSAFLRTMVLVLEILRWSQLGHLYCQLGDQKACTFDIAILFTLYIVVYSSIVLDQ